MQIKHLPTTELTIHPRAKAMPAPDTESAEFRALLATITETGIPRPVTVQAFRAVDNLDVLEAAKYLGITTLPCREIEADDVPMAILSDLVARKHWTKSQIAYLAFPQLQPVLDAAKSRRIANLKKGQSLEKSAQVVEIPDLASRPLREAKTIEDAADALGIGRKLLYYAAQIHKSFDAPGDDEFEAGELRAHFEPLILQQDESGHSVGLGAIVAGIAGYKATRGQTVVPAPQLTLWEERIDKMLAPSRFAGWDKIAPEVREKIAARFRDEFFKCVPDELQAAVLAAATKRRVA